VLSAFSLLILGLPSVASAQWRNDDNYGRNRSGGYDNRNMRSVLNRLEDRSRAFARQVDRELDRSRYDDRRREDRINDIAKDFSNAVNRLEDNFDGGNNGRDDSYREAQRVLTLGNQLENALRRARLSGSLQSQWSVIRQDLNVVANYYGNNNRNNRGRGNNRNNDNWRNNIPFPLPF
jgi:hypothetical protein